MAWSVVHVFVFSSTKGGNGSFSEGGGLSSCISSSSKIQDEAAGLVPAAGLGYPLKGLSLEGGSFRGWSSMMSWTKEEALGLKSLSFMAITTPKSNPP